MSGISLGLARPGRLVTGLEGAVFPVFAKCLTAVALVFVLGGHADADWLTIEDPGFENDAVANGFDDNFVSGDDWDYSMVYSSGRLNPSTASFPAEAPEGENVAWVRGSSIYQVLTNVLASHTSYVLEVQVGNRLDAEYGDYTVQLLAGTTLLAEDNASISVADGTFETSTVRFATTLTHPQLGQPLQIKLTALRAGGAQTCFDDVTLEAAPIPEPSSVTIMTSAILMMGIGVGCRRWRKRWSC